MIADFIKNKWSFLILVIIALFIGGIWSLFTISKESSPSIDLPYYNVTTTYPGADVGTVEEQVTNKLENNFSSISDLDEITSTTQNGISVITLKFFKTKEESEAINDIKTNIDKEFSGFPENVDYPVVKKMSPTDRPVYEFSVAGPYSPKIVYQKVKSLEDNVKSIQGVSEVNVIGKPQKQLKISLDYDRISSLEIDPLMVVSEVRGLFSKRPVGKKQINGDLYNFEVSNYPESLTGIVQQLKNLELMNRDGRAISLRDIGDITNTYEQKDTRSFAVDFTQKVKQGDGVGKEAITLQIKRSPGADIERIIEESKSKINAFKEENPKLQVYEITSDENQIDETFGTFVSNFFQTAAYIFLILTVFIGLKIAVGVSVAFPLVYLITFIIFKSQGITFNTIVSFSLVLTLGIMVDNLVVISESIYNESTKRSDFWENLKITYKKYMLPLIAGTSTTIVMFFPIYLILSGMIGEFIQYLPVTIIINLAMSLLVALLLLPVILKFIIAGGKKVKKGLGARLLYRTGEIIGNLQKKLLKQKKVALLIVLAFWGFFVSAIMLVANGFVKVDFFGDVDGNNIWVNIDYKPGLNLEKNQKKYTSPIFGKIQNYLKEKFSDSLKYTVVNIGTERNSVSSNPSKSYFNIRLVDDDKRDTHSSKIKNSLQSFIEKEFENNSEYSFVKDISLLTVRAGPSSGKPVSFDIVGEDLEEIGNYVEDTFLPEYKKIPEVKDVSTSIEYTKGKMKYQIDKNKAKKFDINPDSVSTLLTSIKNSSYEPYGVGITELREFGEDDVSVNMFMSYSGNLDNIKVKNVYMNKLIEDKKLLSQIQSISHRDTRVSVNISSDKGQGVPLSVITEKVKEIIKENPLPEGMEYKPAGDAQEQQDSMQGLSKAMVVGIFLMFLTIVLLFNNIKYSIMILTSTFLAVGGVFYTLFIFGNSLNFPAQIGIFGVIGVGVNNAILLVQAYLNSLKEDNEKVSSLVNAIGERFPPVFITTLTTIAGLSVLVSDEVWGSLALVFIGGLFVNLFVIVLYIPALLRLTER